VVGDTVNLAARLCGKARHWEILTDQTTAETVDNLIRMEARGEIQVKGKQLKQAIFAPLALSKQDNLGEQRGETTGRSFELNTFRSHFATLQKGTGATLFLTGLPGIGKTQLCRTFYGICSKIEHLEVSFFLIRLGLHIVVGALRRRGWHRDVHSIFAVEQASGTNASPS